MPPVFEAWDLAVKPITARSRLYSLAPIGIGTALVEGLSGYVMRLADAHAVSTGSLIGKELSARVQLGRADLANLGRFWATINGVGDSAKRWVQGLENLTLRSDLRYLTLLPFERLFAKTLLFRRVRAWCSACYEQMASRDEAIYEPLLWCMKLVEVCPRHHGPLATTCPHCFRSQRPLTAGSRPGFCSWCGLWLGHTTDPTPAHPPAAVPTEYQLWVAEAIGKLFADAPRMQPECLRDRARDALLTYVRISAEGNRAAVAEVTGRSIYEWCNGGSAPRIDTLLRTWYQLRLPVECLLDDSYAASRSDVQEQKNMLGSRYTRKVAPSRTREQIRARLEAALDEQPAPSLNEIARRLGYSTAARLYEADRHLCWRITARYRKSGRGNWWRSGGAKAICERSRVKEVLEDYLGSDKPIPSLNHIASSLGYVANTSLRDRFPELCRALSAKIAEQKRARVAAIEPALEEALRENPPPSLQEITKRLGFSSISTLKAYAPGLCEKLKTHRRAYRERCCVELRSKLEAVLTENPPPSLRSVYARFNVTESIVNSSFPELRRAIGLRHLQHQKQQSQVRRQDVQAEIREIVQMLHTQGICPSVPRVTSLLRSGSLREWNAINDAVKDARRELIH